MGMLLHADRRWQTALLVLIVIGLCKGISGAELPAELATALQENAADLDPIDVSWTEQHEPPAGGDRRAAFDRLGLEYPDTIGAYFAATKYRVCWQGRRIYERTDFPQIRADGSIALQATEYAFDGAVFWTGAPVGPAPLSGNRSYRPFLMKDSIETLIKKDPGYGGRMQFEYFENAGFRLPRRASELREPTLRSVVNALLAYNGELTSINKETLYGKKVVCIRLTAENPDWREAQDVNLDVIKQEMRAR